MPITRDEFMGLVQNRVGEDNSDEALEFVQKMSEAYDGLTANSGEYWKSKYEENDSAWREKYKNAFYTADPAHKKPAEKPASAVTFGDLFT